jgi:hypothetical protein
MNVTKTLSIALVIAAVSGMAQAGQPLEHYGRAGTPAASGTVPGTKAAVAVSEVQGRSSAMPAAQTEAPVMLSGRSVDSLGRS